MKKWYLSFVMLLLPFLQVNAQTVLGNWKGTLKTPAGNLSLVLHIKDSNGVWQATMDSPDQQAFGLPVSDIRFRNDSLHFEAMSGAIKYDGILQEDSISGTFRQSGYQMPLVLKRTTGGDAVLERPQKPKPPFPYTSEELSFMNEKAGIRLAGTLTLPESGSHFPVVVLISGSGPQDRDEALLEHKPFLVIADYLTRRGIAVLRFDDRGTAKSEGDFSAATTADFATDVEAAVAFLKKRPEIDKGKIGLIGHSEGGIIAPMVAAADENIDFIVLLAGPGVDGANLLAMQNVALAKAQGTPDEKLKEIKKQSLEIYKVALQDKNKNILKKELMEKLLSEMPESLPKESAAQMAENQAEQLTTPWMRYFLQLNPATYLEKVHCPVLAMNGSKDVQVPADKNIAAIKDALAAGGNRQVTTKIFTNLNHLFQNAQTGLPNEYREIEETFSPKALQFMTEWIKKQVD